MANVVINEQHLEDIADAIRTKNGSSDTYTPAGMAAAITAIATGAEYETGTKNQTASSSTSLAISFSNTHTTAPSIVIAVHTSSTSNQYTNVGFLVNYNKATGTSRGGSSSYYGQCITLRASTSTSLTGLNTSYTSSTINNVLTTSGATLTSSSSYNWATGNYKWIAIWAEK